eukprot:9313750-Alexandrium_andersonii.AAC.1
MGSPSDGRRAASESTLTAQLGAPLRGFSCCRVEAPSPIVRRPLAGCPRGPGRASVEGPDRPLGRLGH